MHSATSLDRAHDRDPALVRRLSLLAGYRGPYVEQPELRVLYGVRRVQPPRRCDYAPTYRGGR